MFAGYFYESVCLVSAEQMVCFTILKGSSLLRGGLFRLSVRLRNVERGKESAQRVPFSPFSRHSDSTEGASRGREKMY